jgi:ribonuclease G
VRVNPETVKVLKANNGSWLVEFEELTGKNILIKSDPTLHPEQFDIQG